MERRVAWLGGLMLSVAGGLVASSAAWADIKVERVTKFGGVMGMGAFDSTETEYLSGDKQRVDGTRKFTGAILGTLMSDAKSARITRLDKDVVWELDLKKKTYTEQSISAAMQRVKEMQQQQQQQRTPAEEPAGGQPAGTGAEEKPEYKIVRNEVTTTKTGASKTIAGYATQQHVVRWEVETENVQTKDRITYIMVSDQWLTPEDAALKQLRSEEEAFAKAYAKLITGDGGFDASQKYGFAALGGILDEKTAEQFQKELAKLTGYPVAIHTRWSTTAKEGQAKQQEGDSSAAGGGTPAGTEEMMRDMGKMFGGLFGKGSSEKDSESQAQAGAESDGPTLFDSYTELKAVQVGAVPADRFELPQGYRKTAP